MLLRHGRVYPQPTTWTAVASSPQLVSELSTNNMYGPSARPRVTGWQRAPGGATLTFSPGYASAGLLASPRRPIVLLARRDLAGAAQPGVAASVAPGLP